MSKIAETHEKLKPEGIYVWPLAKFDCEVKYMKRGDSFRVTVDIPAAQISDKRDVRAMFGDGDCKMIPTLTFIDIE